MASLLQFEEKVHRKDLARSESIPLLMPRLLYYVLEQMGFPEEPGIERRDRCPHVVSVDRVMTMPVHFHIRPQVQEEVPGQEAEDAHRDPPTLEPRYRGLPLPFQIVHLHLLHILLQLQPIQILPGLLIQHTIHRSIHMSARGR